MSNIDYEELVLSCTSWQEAQGIADQLLKKRLANTIEFIEVQAQSWQTNTTKEIKLILQSSVHDFHAVESELANLYGHTNFVLHRSTSIKTPKTRA